MLSFKEEEVRQACFLLPPRGVPLGVSGASCRVHQPHPWPLAVGEFNPRLL